MIGTLVAIEIECLGRCISNCHTVTATNVSSDNIYTYILGPYVARFCMDLAIQKAKTAGIGFVSCRGKYYNGCFSLTLLSFLVERMFHLKYFQLCLEFMWKGNSLISVFLKAINSAPICYCKL